VDQSAQFWTSAWDDQLIVAR